MKRKNYRIFCLGMSGFADGKRNPSLRAVALLIAGFVANQSGSPLPSFSAPRQQSKCHPVFHSLLFQQAASTTVLDGQLVQKQDITVVKPPRAEKARFSSDDQGPMVIFTLVDHPSENWRPMCMVGDDVLISQFTVERPKDGSESPTLLVLRHKDAKKIEIWGNHLADFLMTRYDLLRYTPEG